MDAVVASASELIPCALAEVSLWDAQTGMLTLQAIRSEPDRVYPVGRSFPPGEGYTGWIVREKKPLLVPDVDSFQEIRPHLLPDERPFNAYAGVPLLAGDTLVGTLVLVSNEAGAFNADDIRLLQSMAHQAAVAIHNAQLFKATTRREAELAALNNIAEAVSLSLDLETLLDQTLDQVIEITSADGGAIRLIDAKTNEAVLYAHRGLSEAHVTEASRLPLSEDDPNLSVGVGWVVRTGQVSISEDLWTDARLPVELQEHMVEEGYRSLAEIPLRAQDRVVGTLGVVKNAPSWFGEEDINLLNAIGQQVGIAIANAQLFRETQRKARQLAALNAVASVINRPLLLQEILDLAIEKVIEVMETDAGGIRLLNPDTEELSIVSSKGLTPDYIRRVDCIHLGEGVVGRVAQTGEPIVVRDLTDPSHMVSQAASDEGFHTFAVVPLRTKEEIVGTLGVVTRYIRDFSTEEMDLLTAIGHQIGIAVENARLYEDLARRAKEMEAIQEEALKAERLAAVGRVAASVAHDLRSPLGGIMRSAEFLARPELTPSTREKLSQAILSLTQRLNNTSQQILEYVQKERLLLRRAPCRLSKFLEDVLTVLEVDFSDQGIEVVRDFRYRGELIMDSDRIAQVVYNIAVNARDAMHKGGKFTVSTRKVKDQVEMRFLDTGPGVPVQVGERIFEPFFSYGKRQGAGLGLAIARRIVEEHGGIIRLESREGKGAEFVVTLPLC